MRLHEAIDISKRHGGLRMWRTSERSNGDTTSDARMFCVRPVARTSVEWRKFGNTLQWSWLREFGLDDIDADDWHVENGPLVDHPRQRTARTCNRHDDCWTADDKAWPRTVDHCHDDDCEDCFGK